VGFFAIVGSPPFGTFVSELTILRAAIQQGRTGIAAAYLGLLSLAMIGMAGVFLKMLYGPAPTQVPLRENRLSLVSPTILAVLILVLGLTIPGFLNRTLTSAAELLKGITP
jgi:hydrogenase-4 component F